MQPTADLSILTLVANASLVVKCVLAILVFLSLASWTVIFQKYFTISRAARQVEEFEARFWSGTELNQLLETAKRNHDTAGMTEYLKQSRQDPNALNSVSRAMRAVYNREMDHLERSLPLLASIGSTSPYIGLFGTVWGIMNAFTGLSTLDNVSLAVVAPGIAEALVATAIGLFALRPPPTTTTTTASAASRSASKASAKSSSTFFSASTPGVKPCPCVEIPSAAA